MEALTDGQLAALAGLAGGTVMGLAARLGRFCTLGAVEDALYGGSTLRLRMWGVAIAVAILATFAAAAAGYVVLEEAVYLRVAFNPFASVVGGLMFGYGMALAGNCGYGALARCGGGDMRAFVIVTFLGVSAYMTMSGPLAYVRVWLFPPEAAVAPAGLAHALAGLFGTGVPLAGFTLGVAALLALLARGGLRRHPGMVAWGAAVGLAIASGFVATQAIATHGFDGIAVTSHTFSAPVGDTLLYAMTASGSAVDFGIGSVVGVVFGAFAGSLIKGQFRWEACEDPRELRRQLVGAFLMGTGAVVAVGCSIGQGLSAFAVLAWSAPLTLAAIAAGAALGLRWLISGTEFSTPGWFR